MIVSRCPPTVTVTVTVKGVPAVAVEGAVKLRTACGVAQPNVIEIAIAAINAHKRRAPDAFTVPKGTSIEVVAAGTTELDVW